MARWAKTRHIPHFMKIKIRPEIDISCGSKNGSDQLLGFRVVEWKASQTRNTTLQENTMFLCCYSKLSPYTFMLHKIYTCCKKPAWKSAKTVGKDSGGLHCVYGQKDKTTVWRLEAPEIAFFWRTRAKLFIATRSYILLTSLLSSSLYRLYSSKAGLS